MQREMLKNIQQHTSVAAAPQPPVAVGQGLGAVAYPTHPAMMYSQPPLPTGTRPMQSYPIAAMAMPPMPGMIGMATMGGMQMSYAPVQVAEVEEDTEPDGSKKSNVLPIHGNSATYNINNLLYNNVMESEYFRALYQLRTYHEVIDEIFRSVTHVEPWQTGTSRVPSTAFCLLVKFMLMKLTLKQMKGLLGTEDCPYVRAIGLLYLRYTCPPTDLWKWYEPYLEDEEEIRPCSDQSVVMSIGSYCIKLLTDMQYFGTTLPRIPVPIERKMKVMLLLLEEKKKRRRANMRAKEDGKFAPGQKVKAIYSDDANEPAWYEAVIDSVDEEKDCKFWVTFPEYGNTEFVDLGDMELIVDNSKEKRQNSRDRHERNSSRGRDRSNSRRNNKRDDSRDRKRRRSDSRDRKRDRSRSNEREKDSSTSADNLWQKVLQSEREASAAVGRNYGQRPASYKGSLSLKMDRYTARKKSPTPPPRRDRVGPARRRSRSRSPIRNSEQSSSSSGNGQEQVQKLKILKDRYGDASAN